MGGTLDYGMVTAERALLDAVEPRAAGRSLTLDPAFQGLPDTAHGGSVLINEPHAELPSISSLSWASRSSVNFF